MYNSPLKVFGEALIPATDIASAMTGTNVVRLGGGTPGVEVRVIVEESGNGPDAPVVFNVGDTITISLMQSYDGETFVAMPECACILQAPQDDPQATAIQAVPGTVLARMSLPYGSAPYIKGSLAFSNTPQGKVSLCPGYLPR